MILFCLLSSFMSKIGIRTCGAGEGSNQQQSVITHNYWRSKYVAVSFTFLVMSCCDPYLFIVSSFECKSETVIYPLYQSSKNENRFYHFYHKESKYTISKEDQGSLCTIHEMNQEDKDSLSIIVHLA